jgi:HD-GYP domain-containing protein (c-di-GMP phosphodiesterase class II)
MKRTSKQKYVKAISFCIIALVLMFAIPTVNAQENASLQSSMMINNDESLDLLINSLNKKEKTMSAMDKLRKTLRGVITELKLGMEKKIYTAFAKEENTEEVLSIEEEVEQEYVNELIAHMSAIDTEAKNALIKFIAYGTPTTKNLGSRERAGIVHSYKDAFGVIPVSPSDWVDVLKIGNGQLTELKSVESEENAKATFLSIYGRNANLEKEADQLAITMMAYGVRPEFRNLANEYKAIGIFKSMYGYLPKSTQAWNVVRAMSYSPVMPE